MFTSSVLFESRRLKNAKARDVRLWTNQEILFGISAREFSMPLHEEHVKDRRIDKTISLLHEALGSLIREKPYDAIVVQGILDRANVGRSTFYMHFRDKDDLLVSGIRNMIGSAYTTKSPSAVKRHERFIRFSLPIFEHIHRHRDIGSAKMGARGRAVIHEHLRKELAELIATDVKKDLQSHRKTAGQIPSDLLVQYIASTFILVLNWWVESRSPLPPNDINNLFRELILPTLTKWE
jgi:AcrR family transcriptional regulator